jgi:hydrophobic/amphiphilic exporter-1 (mainly G- bacteria), HAE1 family
MSSFAIKYPFFILMLCLMIAVVGVVTVLRMPVDLFPSVNIPVVVVATFYSGMPPQQIESDITDTYERFFTFASDVDRIESRSLPGVSLIKIYFHPGTNPNAAVSNVSDLAMANLRRLPPGTLPPVVLKYDASNLPVCLVTLKGQGLNETQLKDVAQFSVRNQIFNHVPSATVPQPYGGRYRQIMVYVDPVKLQAHELSLMDVVHAINDSNLILPAGDVRIGTKDFNIYANSQVDAAKDMNDVPLKTVGNSSVLVGDIGHAEDAGQLQTNIVRVDGQRSVYIPIMKNGANSNTIQIVNGVRDALADLLNVPSQLRTSVAFDQSVFVRTAVKNLATEGSIGLLLTAVMVLLFLGNARATVAVLLSIPLSSLAAFIALDLGGSTINTMVLAGLALAFSRLIDNSVVVLENIFRHMELGETPMVASEKGGKEVQLAVLAATVSTSIVFFPVMFLYGVSKYLFSALALSVVLAMFASYAVAMTVVPLFCSRFIQVTGMSAHGPKHASEREGGAKRASFLARVALRFDRSFRNLQARYEAAIGKCLIRPWTTVGGICAFVGLSFMLYPFLGHAFFPRTDPGQFVIDVKAPTGSRVEVTDEYIARVEEDIRDVIPSNDLEMIVSNIGITPDLSAIYTSNSGMHTAFVQVSLKEGHKTGSYQYMDRVRQKLARDLPQLSTYFQAGGLADSIVNQGLPAPFDIQVSTSDLDAGFSLAQKLAQQVKALPGVSDVLIPQDMDYPGLQLNINRERTSMLGLSPKEVVDNVITALTSNGMIAPSYWVDPNSGNNYMVTVQYPESQIQTLNDFEQIPLHGDAVSTTPLDSVASVHPINTPTEVDHFQLRPVIDIYVMPSTESLSRVSSEIDHLLATFERPNSIRIAVRGSVTDMQASFQSFGWGLVLAVALVYLVLVAQFSSFKDPFLILLALPPGLSGVLLFLLATGSTLNIMSLMGVIMMTGIVMSNSILIVEFTGVLRNSGTSLTEALVEACKVRLRPIIMTTVATLLGLIPLALALESGSEQYAPLAWAMIGGLIVSGVATVFLVPSAYYLAYRRMEGAAVNPRVDGGAA